MLITGFRIIIVLLSQLSAPAQAALPKGRVIELQPPVISESHALVDAVDDNSASRLRALFDKGFSPASTIKNKLHESLLARAASHGSDRAFEVILSEMKIQGLKPKLTDSRGTPLIVVLASLAVVGQKRTEKYEHMALALIQAAPESLQLTDRAYVGDGRTALHQAAASGNVKLLSAFVSHGANVNARNTSGETPLHLAARFGHVDAVRYLVSAGADVHAKTKYTKATPLMSAAEMGQETVIRTLMASGAKKDERDYFGKSAPERYKEYAANFYTRMNSPKKKSNRGVSTTSTPVPRIHTNLR